MSLHAYQKSIQIRWSDLDPNFHLRHSVYYDYAAFCRISFLEEHGLTAQIMQQLNFRKEIRFSDRIQMDLQIKQARTDFSRWTIIHQLLKNENTLAAVITVDGAWMDTSTRKLATPPPQIKAVFDQMPRTADFSFTV
jgi:acyl-CoA thioester hydrolase